MGQWLRNLNSKQRRKSKRPKIVVTEDGSHVVVREAIALSAKGNTEPAAAAPSVSEEKPQ